MSTKSTQSLIIIDKQIHCVLLTLNTIIIIYFYFLFELSDTIFGYAY